VSSFIKKITDFMSFPQVCGKIERKKPQKLKKGVYLRFPNFIKSHFLSF